MKRVIDEKTLKALYPPMETAFETQMRQTLRSLPVERRHRGARRKPAAVLVAAAVLALLLIANLFSSAIKRITLRLCSVFNDHIKLKGERFFWTLINTFRDIRRVNFTVILAETVGMWEVYIGSYALFAAFMQRLGSDYALVEIILSLFSRSSLDLSALTVAASSSAVLKEQLWLAVYTLLPSVIMFAATLTKAFTTVEKLTSSVDG